MTKEEKGDSRNRRREEKVSDRNMKYLRQKYQIYLDDA